MYLQELNFTQSTPATVWTITHNFGYKPVADVMIDLNGVKTKILPLTVVHVDDNTLQINFTAARAGAVRLL